MLLRSTALALLLWVGGCSSLSGSSVAQTSPGSSAPDCALAPTDRRWLDDSVAAWTYALDQLAQAQPKAMTALIFDGSCKLSSATAMAGGAAAWSASKHDGVVSLPDGNSLPAQVTSFAAPAGEGAFFVMAAPSIWTAAGVQGGPLPLETLMTAVMVHEGVHVLQFPTYGTKISEMTSRHGLPDSFNDDSIQDQFEANQEFAGSVARETDLLFAAAAAADIDQVRKLAREARMLMLARQDRWFRGNDAYLREAEDIWLSMEGSGQWLAYRWLTAPAGGNVPEPVALTGFAKRGKSWSQKQGVALFLTLERLAPVGWKAKVFGGGSETATQLLDAELAAGG